MITWSIISVGIVWGGLLALSHFGGLKLSLALMTRVARPTLWFYGGLLVRYAITLTGMWCALKLGPPALMAACAGFYLMRMVVVPRLSEI